MINQHVYSISPFWVAAEATSELAYWAAPILFLVASSWILWRSRNLQGWALLLGACLLSGERIARLFSNGIHWVYLGSRHPTVDQNPIELFFFLHGEKLGYMVIAISLVFIVKKGFAQPIAAVDAPPKSAAPRP